MAKIDELIQQELPQLVDERRFRRRDQEQQPQVERDEYGRVSPHNPGVGGGGARLVLVANAQA